MPTLDTAILIVAVTAVIIVVVITVRVLTGRGWSNLSKKPEKQSSDSKQPENSQE